MKKPSKREHRRYLRLPVEVRAEYRELEDIIDTTDLKSSRIKNLSPGGLLFKSAEKTSQNAVLQIKFRLTDGRKKLEIPAIARVAHCRKTAGAGYDIGVEFMQIEPGDLALLEKFVGKQALKNRKHDDRKLNRSPSGVLGTPGNAA